MVQLDGPLYFYFDPCAANQRMLRGEQYTGAANVHGSPLARASYDVSEGLSERIFTHNSIAEIERYAKARCGTPVQWVGVPLRISRLSKYMRHLTPGIVLS